MRTPTRVCRLVAATFLALFVLGCGESPFVGTWRFDDEQTMPYVVEQIIAETAASRGGQPSKEATEFANELTRPIFERMARGMVEAMDSTLEINDDASFKLTSHTAEVEPLVGIWSDSEGVATFTFTINGIAANSTATIEDGSLRYAITSPSKEPASALRMVYVRQEE